MKHNRCSFGGHTTIHHVEKHKRMYVSDSMKYVLKWRQTGPCEPEGYEYA